MPDACCFVAGHPALPTPLHTTQQPINPPPVSLPGSTASGVPGGLCVHVHALDSLLLCFRPPTPAPCLPCSAASGVPGGVFVHASGFIGGAATFEGAVAMAAKALDMD